VRQLRGNDVPASWIVMGAETEIHVTADADGAWLKVEVNEMRCLVCSSPPALSASYRCLMHCHVTHYVERRFRVWDVGGRAAATDAGRARRPRAQHVTSIQASSYKPYVTMGGWVEDDLLSMDF